MAEERSKKAAHKHLVAMLFLGTRASRPHADKMSAFPGMLFSAIGMTRNRSIMLHDEKYVTKFPFYCT